MRIDASKFILDLKVSVQVYCYTYLSHHYGEVDLRLSYLIINT